MRKALALLCLAALAGPGAAAGAQRDVTLRAGNVFNPQAVRLLPGDTVRWTNKDFTWHDVWSDPDGSLFQSARLDPNHVFAPPVTFDDVGSLGYRCVRHPTMRGTIRVAHAWLNTPPVVTHPNAVKLTGLAPFGEEVFVERLDGADWIELGSTPMTAANGSFSITLPTPPLPGTYRARVTGGESQNVNVAVKPRVTIAKRKIPRKRYRVTVASNLKQAGVRVTLQRRTNVGWKRLAAKKLNKSSKAVFVVAPKGAWRIRAVVKAAGGYAAGQSPVIAVKR